MEPTDSGAVNSATTRGAANRLFRSTSLVAVMTLISRLLGFLRDVVFAQIFGAGAEFDAFVVAFKLPNFMRRLFAEGAFSQAFVPVLAQYRETRSDSEIKQLINHVAGNLAFVLLLVVALAEIFSPWLIYIFAPGFVHDGVRYQLATHMLRITFPYLWLISLTAFVAAILNTWNRFGIPAFTPVLLNIALIGVAWFWAPHTAHPIYVLAFGVILGGVLQLGWQLLFLKRIGFFPKPSLSWRDPGVRRVLTLMVPAIFGASVAQISVLIDNVFASFLPAGSISWLYYSDRLTYLPQGVIGVALATVALPNLSRQFSRGDQQQYAKTLDWAMRLALLVGIPSAVGLFVLAGPMLATLFHHGKFNAHDVLMTRQSLMAFSIGLPAFMLVKILASAFYSRQDIKTPVKIAALAVVVNVVFNFLLIKPMAQAGLALATSIAAFVNVGLLIFYVLRKDYFQAQSGWTWFLLRVGIANVVMAAVIYYFAGSLQLWLQWHTWTCIWRLASIIMVGIAVYFAVLWVIGFRIKHFILRDQ